MRRNRHNHASGRSGGIRRSFRTHRLCAIPGVSPRAGMRCPVGALRTPLFPRAFLRGCERRPDPAERPKYAKRSGIGPQRALEANNKTPSRNARKFHPPQSLLSERRPDPAEHPIRQAERDRAAASLGGDHQSPSRKARKPNPPQSLLSERRPDPAERPPATAGLGRSQHRR